MTEVTYNDYNLPYSSPAQDYVGDYDLHRLGKAPNIDRKQKTEAVFTDTDVLYDDTIYAYDADTVYAGDDPKQDLGPNNKAALDIVSNNKDIL